MKPLARLALITLTTTASLWSCKTVDRTDPPGGVKFFTPAGFDQTIQSEDSSSFAARLYRTLETSAATMQDAGVPVPVHNDSALSVSWHGDFVTCDVTSKPSKTALVASHSCHIATASRELPWTDEEDSLQAVLYRSLVLRQGGTGILSLVGGDGRSLDCERRRSFGQTEYRCMFNTIAQQDPQ